MSTVEAATIARRAAEIIQQRGKATGQMFDGEGGPVCLWGAIRLAQEEAAGNVFDLIGEGPLRTELVRRFPRDSQQFPGSFWNDRTATDERDVAKMLLQVADRLDVAS